MQKLLITSLLVVVGLTAHAQFRTGVTIGLNISKQQGPSELDAAGANAETFDNVTGFFIGPSFTYDFTDHFGLRGEFMYSKKGTRYQYKGPLFRNYTLDNNQGTRATVGIGTQTVVVTNTYFDIPVMATARFWNIELSGGLYGSVLFSSVGDGSLQYNSDDLLNDGGIEHNLRYNYFRDDPGESEGDNQTFEALFTGNRKSTVPKTIGAYYDETTDNGSLYRVFDYGAIGGLSYYISRTLYLGARVQYGLSDLTRNAADRARNSQTPTYRDDFDRNFVIQAKVGFSF